MRQVFFIMASLLLLTGCEKEIVLNLADKSGNVVIEGNVTNGPGPYYVRITRSVAFMQGNQYPEIADAGVIIRDDSGTADTLEYMGGGRYKTAHLIGVPGQTYTLHVLVEGASFTAQSTMPQPVALDSLVQGSFSFGGESTYNVRPVFQDPGALGNRYLFILSVNKSKNKDLETFSDNINNGRVNQRNLIVPMNDEENAKAGDTVHVEMRGIDPGIHAYYNALIQISGEDGSGITPANPPSNISNGALGYFSAHTSAAKSIILR